MNELLSEKLKDINNIIEEIYNISTAGVSELSNMEGEVKDLMHEISLGNKRNMYEGYLIYNDMRELLIKRYKLRDKIETCSEAYNLLKEKDITPDTFRVLSLGAENIEITHSNRCYKPRVRDDLTMKQPVKNTQIKKFEDKLKLFKENLKKK